MALNIVTLNGRLPKYEGIYSQGEKASYMLWAVSVKRDYKPEGSQYYPEDLLKFKAYGANADFIKNHFAQGDGIIIVGKLLMEDDYEKDGQLVKGQMYVHVDKVAFADGKTSNGEQGGNNSAPAKPGNSLPKANKVGPKAGIPKLPKSSGKTTLPRIPKRNA